MTKTVRFRNTDVPVSDSDYQALATIGAEATARFFAHLDSEAKAGVEHLRSGARKPEAEHVQEKAKQLHDIVGAMRKARGQA